MIALTIHDPLSGCYSDVRFHDPTKASVADLNMVERMLNDALETDVAGHGVILIIEWGPMRIEHAMGPSPFPEADGVDRVAWLDTALCALRAMLSYGEHCRALK